MEFDKELLARAKKAKTIEELTVLAGENGTELTAESARAYFDLLHPRTGELSDDELDNVAGGACYKGDRPVVTVGHDCGFWVCKKDGNDRKRQEAGVCVCSRCGTLTFCNTCKHCSYEKGLWLCNNELNQKI